MTDSMQGAYTAGILATGAAGVESVEEDERVNDTIIARITDPGPVKSDSDGTSVEVSAADPDTGPN